MITHMPSQTPKPAKLASISCLPLQTTVELHDCMILGGTSSSGNSVAQHHDQKPITQLPCHWVEEALHTLSVVVGTAFMMDPLMVHTCGLGLCVTSGHHCI